MITPCGGCGELGEDAEMWRLTRRPDLPVVAADVATFADVGPVLVQVSGPEHMVVCGECWSHFCGWVGRLAEVRSVRPAASARYGVGVLPEVYPRPGP